MRNLTKDLKIVTLALSAIALSSCGKGKSNSSSLTGWNSKDKAAYGISSNNNYKGQETPPGMVLIEGGTFTMGHVQDDVMFDWNTTPVKQQVRSFYLDESEVTNSEYLFYLEWTKLVFPPSNMNYENIYSSALPDTLVWRDVLGFNELLTENYLRHPSYANYPVVGVSWRQAVNYCKWRGERVNEKILIDMGVLKSMDEMDSIKIEGANHFNTDSYLLNPNGLYGGDSTVYKKGLPSEKKLKKGESKPEKGSFSGRHVKISDGKLQTKFRLPTEAEWEYAAKAVVENREYNTIRGRKKFAWDGKYTRNKNKKFKGDQVANFKQGDGDYSGVAGWSSDGADITQEVKFYEANAFGLYDMSGNVAEWVSDVYRPIIDDEANDFNYYRGNVFTKRMIDEDGKVVVQDVNEMVFDTLDNGKVVPVNVPGEIKTVPITKRDAFMRNNYEKSYNIDARDGDLASTKNFDKDEEYADGNHPRMYNSPLIPKELGESGLMKQAYDDNNRTTLVSDQSRVYKGGSWKDREYWLDPAHRRHLPEYMATNYIGFRCATDRLGAMTNDRRTPYHNK